MPSPLLEVIEPPDSSTVTVPVPAVDPKTPPSAAVTVVPSRSTVTGPVLERARTPSPEVFDWMVTPPA